MEKMISKPLLLGGEIMHYRRFPKKNHFRYKSTYIAFPLSAIEKLKNPFFSIGKFNLFGLYQSDYGHHSHKKFKNWIKKILKENKINNVKEIVLVTHPRLLGYVFNPVSFWLCLNEQNQLIAVLSEVNNTCGQKHSYLCYHSDLREIKANDELQAEKTFYVSPFMAIEGYYKFRFEYLANSMNFYIDYLVDKQLKLSTSLKCNFEEYNTKNLLLHFFKRPLFTFKTIFLIHYQALKLYLKSITFHKCPSDLSNNVTLGNKK